MMHFAIIFDGGSLGNPGKAYGSYRIQAQDLPAQPVRRRSFGNGTNNEAEYRTLAAAVDDLLRQLHRRGIDPSTVRLTIRGDSQLVIRQLRGEWKAKDGRMRQYRDEIHAKLQRFGRANLEHQPRSASVRVLGH
jgi:ribonuclease HI